MKKYILPLMLLLLSSCRTYIPVAVDKTVTHTEYEYLYDSVYVRDSVMVESMKDTLIITKWKTMYRERVLKDTVRITDSISKPIIITQKETIRDPVFEWYHKALMMIGAFVVILFVVIILYKVKRFV